MNIVILGSGGFYPTNARQTNCLWIPRDNIVIDAGTGFSRVKDFDKTIPLHVFLTHAHLDHTCGLPYLFEENIHLHSRTVDYDYVKNCLFGGCGFPPVCKFKHVEQKSSQINNWTVLSRNQTKHAGGSVGYRFNCSDFSFAYITDTEVDFEGLDFVRGVDILFHECFYSSEVENLCGHSTPLQVGKFAKYADVKKLFLIHVNPNFSLMEQQKMLASVQSEFENTFLATDYLKIGFK